MNSFDFDSSLAPNLLKMSYFRSQMETENFLSDYERERRWLFISLIPLPFFLKRNGRGRKKREQRMRGQKRRQIIPMTAEWCPEREREKERKKRACEKFPLGLSASFLSLPSMQPPCLTVGHTIRFPRFPVVQARKEPFFFPEMRMRT